MVIYLFAGNPGEETAPEQVGNFGLYSPGIR